MGAKLLLAVVAVGLFAMIPVKLLGFPPTTTMLFYYVCVAACGFYAPSIWLKRVTAARQDTLHRAIPDALDLMVVCVESGLGLDQAIARVGQEVSQAHPILADELNVLSQELRTGVQRQVALRNLAKRTDIEEVRNLVALLVQTDRFGTSIGQALRVHADSMRTTRRLKAEEMAAKLPVKLLFPLVCFIFPSMFIVTIGPAGVKVVRELFPVLLGK
jgi:tight adherence protein C